MPSSKVRSTPNLMASSSASQLPEAVKKATARQLSSSPNLQIPLFTESVVCQGKSPIEWI